MDLKKLINDRRDVLFAEIGALIHDLGKLSREFVEEKSQEGISFNFDHEDILKNRSEYNNFLPANLKNLLNSNLGINYNQMKQKVINIPRNLNSISKFGQFISKHGSGKNLFPIVLLTPPGADGIDSAIDKMVTNHKFAQQSKDHVYISTAFGYENQKIDLNLSDTDEKSLTKIRNEYADKLAKILENLKNNSNSVQDWIKEREKLLNETKKAFLNALGETRRPANDVTLWDHSYSVASLYKAALAEVVLNGWKAPREIKWRFLGIRFSGSEFYNAVPKIGDVLGRKALVEKILDNIKILLEVIIPIGNEVYRDEDGSIFLVPESCEDGKILEVSENVWSLISEIELETEINFVGGYSNKKLREIVSSHSTLKEIIEKLSSHMSEGIFIPETVLSSPSRGALNLGKIISERRKLNIDKRKLEEKWQNKSEGYERCSVCNLRPIPLKDAEYEELSNKAWSELDEEKRNGIKAYERKECIDCLKLSSSRVKEWFDHESWDKESPENSSFDTTIWVDEVADENNRIGLVYIKFDLEKWLNGEMLDTFFSNPLLVGEFKNQFEDELFNVYDYDNFINLLKESFERDDFNIELSVTKKDGITKLKAKELFEILIGRFFDNSPIEVFKSIVEDREPDWQNIYGVPEGSTKGDNKHRAVVFLLHATRKHPSFARLRRIWETTRNFGIEIFERKKEELPDKKRTIFKFSNASNLKITHTYYFKDKNDIKGELVVLEDSKAAIISAPANFNLEEKDSLEIYSDKYFRDKICSVSVSKIEQSSYRPIIPYQFEPSNTMFFVPLKDITWETITEIKRQYEIQFNKVQNRLPIKIGFVAFHKKTPMYAVLDAARRLMEYEHSDCEILEIDEIDEISGEENCVVFGGKIGNKIKKIEFKNKETYYFSYSTKDPNKEDLFHPYFVTDDNGDWKIHINGGWKTVKHVKTLQKGDKVEFCLSWFDFVYLDTNTRRLDVGKNRIHWLFKKVSPKPYRLKQVEEFEYLKELLIDKLQLTSSQLLNGYELFISKLQEWEIDKIESLPIADNIFKEFIESVILNNPFRLKIKEDTKKGQINRDDFNFLKKTILNGVFFDFIDMWHTVLKRKFKEDKND